MSVMKLPSGRWRAQVYDPAIGGNVSVSRILGGPGTFATKSEAKRAREQARERISEPRSREVTVRAFWERWTSDPLFARPKESTNIHNRERTLAFVELYNDRCIDEIDDEIVATWLAGGQRNGTVPAFARDVQRRCVGEGGPDRASEPLRTARDLQGTGPSPRAAAERGAGLEADPLRARAGEPIVCGVAPSCGLHGPAAGGAGCAAPHECRP
jgi:hypothetical protein